MKSRATKRREAWQLIAGVGGVVAGLLILILLDQGGLNCRGRHYDSLITVAGTLSGVFIGSWLRQRQRRQEDRPNAGRY